MRQARVSSGGMANGNNRGGGAAEDVLSKLPPTERITAARAGKRN